jgi:tetratricopeptide (TPR) repeat protein
VTTGGVFISANKGIAFVNLKKTHKAIECFDNALKIVPSAGGVWYNKAIVLSNLGKKNDADRCFAKANQLGYES